MTLRYQISELNASIDALLAAYPELRDDDVLRADMFEAETNIRDVLTRLVREEREAVHSANAVKAWMDELGERQARFTRRKEALRKLMQAIMDRAGEKSIPLPEATLSLGWKKPTRIVTDEAALPDEFCKTERTPDLEKIKAAPEIPAGVAMSNGKRVFTVRAK